MLGEHPIHPVLLAADLAATRDLYHGQLGLEVLNQSDVRAEVAELRSRGVKVEDYDLPGLHTNDGIADLGFAWAAWIIDPGRNALGILQIKQ
jgi:catechol 2,3-dioxygenase-like lactoylglutathione lyase family enzyme